MDAAAAGMAELGGVAPPTADEFREFLQKIKEDVEAFRVLVAPVFSNFSFCFFLWVLGVWVSRVYLLMGFARRRVSKAYGFLVALLS